MSLPDKKSIYRTVKKDMALIGILLALCIVLMFANFWYTTVTERQDRLSVGIAGELRVLSQSIAKHAANAASGRQEAFSLLRKRRDDFDEGLHVLKNGDPKWGIPGVSIGIASNELGALESTWRLTKAQVDVILARQETLLHLHQAAESIAHMLPVIQDKSERLVSSLQKRESNQQALVQAAKQAILLQKIGQHVAKVMDSDMASDESAEVIANDTKALQLDLKGMIEGNRELERETVNDSNSASLLQAIKLDMAAVMKSIDQISTMSREYALVNSASFNIYTSSQTLLDQASTLNRALSEVSTSRFIGEPTGYMLGATCLLLFVWLAYRIYTDFREMLTQTTAQNKANRAAVWRLLDELSTLADGDLTVQATVSDDITGAIAESVNYAIEALRRLVSTINETAVVVSSSAQESQSTAFNLAQASESQAREIVSATAKINGMTQSIEQVSNHSTESATVAEQSVSIAKHGVEVVQNTTQGMQRIREQIQETSKQIKRLGESTQEVGHIIALINDISDQTHILALNASIQAGMAGEAGKGFAVVAQEVQHLAERAYQATKQVETLVHTIQKDTQNTVTSMEHTTHEVVLGAQLAQDAGLALERIEQVSLKLAERIKEISLSAKVQAQTSNQVSKTMEIIKDISAHTSMGSTATANAIGHLAEKAVELRESVAGFRLPVEIETQSRAG